MTESKTANSRVIRCFFGLAILLIATSFSLDGFQSYGAGLAQGLADGMGFMLMVWP